MSHASPASYTRFHALLVDYYGRLMGCTAEDAELLATHIMATLERRGNGRGGADVVYNCSNEKRMPATAINSAGVDHTLEGSGDDMIIHVPPCSPIPSDPEHFVTLSPAVRR